MAAAVVKSQRDGICQLEVEGEDVREALCRDLVTQGMGVLRVDRGQDDLEKVFLELSKGDER